MVSCHKPIQYLLGDNIIHFRSISPCTVSSGVIHRVSSTRRPLLSLSWRQNVYISLNSMHWGLPIPAQFHKPWQPLKVCEVWGCNEANFMRSFGQDMSFLLQFIQSELILPLWAYLVLSPSPTLPRAHRGVLGKRIPAISPTMGTMKTRSLCSFCLFIIL